MSTPIPPTESHVRFGRHTKITAKRSQFPLCLAWAVTIHTELKIVVSCKGTVSRSYKLNKRTVGFIYVGRH